ncbi:hypothetical protein [Bacillus coahuilensis]|uniref:hypothetical protein n=1 Tax=Bacillus coahuilensis TaxID=408580 RepID=UPI0001850A1F|nr:hypothetical protein [Bacillus coahuilensis]
MSNEARMEKMETLIVELILKVGDARAEMIILRERMGELERKASFYKEEQAEPTLQ